MKSKWKSERFNTSFAMFIDSLGKITKDLGKNAYKSF